MSLPGVNIVLCFYTRLNGSWSSGIAQQCSTSKSWARWQLTSESLDRRRYVFQKLIECKHDEINSRFLFKRLSACCSGSTTISQPPISSCSHGNRLEVNYRNWSWREQPFAARVILKFRIWTDDILRLGKNGTFSPALYQTWSPPPLQWKPVPPLLDQS